MCPKTRYVQEKQFLVGIICRAPRVFLMLTAMASFQPWPKYNKDLPPVAPDYSTDYPAAKALPPTPGVKAVPSSIAQLAMPSPDSSSSSNTSHEPFDLARYDFEVKRRPNRLRKAPPSSYPFSFVPEDPSPSANFPYIFHRSTPTSPASSFLTSPSRALSMTPISKPVRKLTKRRPSLSDPPATAAADIPMSRIAELPPLPPLQRRSTFNLGLRRKKPPSKATQSEDGHGSLPPLPPPSPLILNMVCSALFLTISILTPALLANLPALPYSQT